MSIDKNLLNCICKQDVRSSAKLLWLLIMLEEKDHSGFCHLSHSEWQEKLNISLSYLKKHLKNLHDKYLIEKDYRPNEEGGKKLFVKTCRPQTVDNMTFFAQFEGIEERTLRFGLARTVRFKDIRNINNTICINHMWLDLKPEDDDSKALAEMEEGEYVCFQARVKKPESGKYFLTNIHNIRRSHEYYDNR